MPQITDAKRKRGKMKFVAAIVEGKNQTEAYLEAFPKVSRNTAQCNGSKLANQPDITEHIQQALATIEKKDASDIVRGVVKDAKGATKSVIYNSSGDTKRIDDTTKTIASRDQFFKLANHPAFTKQTNISVGLNANMDAEFFSAFNESVKKLDDIADKLTGLTYASDEEYIDAEIIPSGETESGTEVGGSG